MPLFAKKSRILCLMGDFSCLFSCIYEISCLTLRRVTEVMTAKGTKKSGDWQEATQV